LFSLLPPGFPAVPRYFLHTFDLDTLQTARSKTQNVRCVDAGLIKHTPPRMEDFAVPCPLVPGVPHLVSGSCSSPHIFGLGFLQTPPRGDALALLLAFGCAYTWHGDLHPVSSVPCPAHIGIGRGLAASPLPHHRTYGSRIRRFGRFSQGELRTLTGASSPGVPAASSSQRTSLARPLAGYHLAAPQ
jgi:hypothetical protein